MKYAYLGLWEFYGSITGVPEAPEAPEAIFKKTGEVVATQLAQVSYVASTLSKKMPRNL